jgi:hypothetical protein
MAAGSYPVQFAIEYPDRKLDRASSAFRVFAAIPVLILLGAIAGGDAGFRVSDGDTTTSRTFAAAGGLLVIAPLLMILFRQKYPRWWFDWNRNLLGFTNRVGAYCLLLTDVYPATDEEQSVHLELPFPDVERDLNRWFPLVKWLLAIPHYVVLAFLAIGVVVCTVVAWFAILLTGRYPRALFDYTVGVGRWANRVAAYAFVLATDEYPPFRLAP